MSGIPIDDFIAAPPALKSMPWYREFTNHPDQIADMDAHIAAQKMGGPLFNDIPEGHMRLFRGDYADGLPQPGEDFMSGRWFTPDPIYATDYGDLSYVDVPEDVGRASHARSIPGSHARVENLLPAEMVADARVIEPGPGFAESRYTTSDLRPLSANPTTSKMSAESVAQAVVRDNETFRAVDAPLADDWSGMALPDQPPAPVASAGKSVAAEVERIPGRTQKLPNGRLMEIPEGEKIGRHVVRRFDGVLPTDFEEGALKHLSDLEDMFPGSGLKEVWMMSPKRIEQEGGVRGLAAMAGGGAPSGVEGDIFFLNSERLGNAPGGDLRGAEKGATTTKSINEVIDHEFGHHLHNQLYEEGVGMGVPGTGAGNNAPPILAEMKGVYGGDLTMDTRYNAGDALKSRYATQDVQEVWAESTARGLQPQERWIEDGVPSSTAKQVDPWLESVQRRVAEKAGLPTDNLPDLPKHSTPVGPKRTPIPEPLRARAEAAMDAARNPKFTPGTGDPFVRLDEILGNTPKVEPPKVNIPFPPKQTPIPTAVPKAAPTPPPAAAPRVRAAIQKSADDLVEKVSKPAAKKMASQASSMLEHVKPKHLGIAAGVVGGLALLTSFANKRKPEATAAVTGEVAMEAAPVPSQYASLGEQNRSRRMSMENQQRAGSFLNSGTSSARNGLAVRTRQY